MILVGHTAWVISLAFSPDDRLLTSIKEQYDQALGLES